MSESWVCRHCKTVRPEPYPKSAPCWVGLPGGTKVCPTCLQRGSGFWAELVADHAKEEVGKQSGQVFRQETDAVTLDAKERER